MIAIILIAALIVYGTLYPWSFQSNPNASVGLLLRPLRFAFTPRVTADAVLNVLMYVPLGLAIFLRVRRASGALIGSIVVVAFCFSLSFALEYLQFFQRGRVPTGTDIVTNTIGGMIGVAVAPFWARLAFRVHAPSGAALLLWPAWIASFLFPFMPQIGRWTTPAKIAAAMSFSIGSFLGCILQFLIAGILLAKERKTWIGMMLLLIPAQIFVADRQPTLAVLFGAAVGSGLALSRLRPSYAAALAATLLLLWGLAPFRTGAHHTFVWIPFADALGGSISNAVAVFLTKIFSYAGTMLLFVRAGMKFPTAAMAVVGILGITEVAQISIVGRTPAITDPVLAALLAAVLSRVGHRV